MIESLNGFFETVNYKQSTSIKLYDNNEYENYPPHWHTTMEIIMPTENIYTVECNNQTIVLREGDIILICPCCIHTLLAPPTGRRIIFQPETSSLRFMKDIEPLLNIISPLLIITPEDYPAIHETIRKLLIEIKEEYLNAAFSFSEVIIYSKLLEIITLIGRNQTSHAGNQSGIIAQQKEYMEKFLSICDYIEAHCSEDLTLDAVSDLYGFSKFYFSRLFKQFTKVSFYKYVNQKRIAKAAELLIEPKRPITDIALSCGFSSLSSFIRMFKIIKGCTPTEFRNLYRL
ncbi:MAG: AraC family transcriptional regulator [Lachnospiraceae bacterium]|jgi:AraC-like DNA-binding protein/ribosomal protein S27E|nr:AraC family transcriptional regulator [Lachnospiraceae bacterium]MCI8995631.1 AraC family transcriptional regulator [Lachnospiraceae bacterium]MCI9133005.1 AraC family transcriptional regulator [Lachnospiraceae bacterium]